MSWKKIAYCLSWRQIDFTPIRKCDKVIPVDGGDPGKGGAFGQNKGSLLGSILPTGQHLQGVEIGTYIMSWFKVRKPESLIEYSHL